MKKVNINEINSSIISKLNLISELTNITSFDLETLEIDDDNLKVNSRCIKGTKNISLYKHSKQISIRIESENEQTYSVHLIKISDEVALKTYVVDNSLIDSCLVKINFNLINSVYDKIDTKEYTLKLEKRRN